MRKLLGLVALLPLLLGAAPTAPAVPEQHFGKACTLYAPDSPSVDVCRVVNLNDFSPLLEGIGWLDVRSISAKVNLYIYRVTLWHDPPGAESWHVDARNEADKYVFGRFLDSTTDWVGKGCGLYHTAFSFRIIWPGGATTGILVRDSLNVSFC